jgi:phosphoribosylanthranilate isomerase
MNIKVCGMRHQANIEDLVQLNPDYLGFIFYPESKRFIGKQIPPEILAIIPDRIQKVGVFVDEPFKSLVDTFRNNHLDIIQLHGNESQAYCKSLKKLHITIIKAFRITPDFNFATINQYDIYCDFYLFDTGGALPGGTGMKFDWNKLEEYNGEIPFFLSGGIQQTDVEAIKSLTYPQFQGIDLNSRFEIEPGLKDIPKLNSFFNEFKT